MRATFGESAEEIAKGIWREVYRLDKKLPDRALEALREREWAIHSVDEDARIVAENSPRYREYVERLGKIADLLKAAARELVEKAEREGRGSVRWSKNKPYFAYEGPAESSARIEHVEKDGRKYAVIEAKYGDRVARVELEVEELRRAGLLHNLAAIMTDDARNFYEGYVLHGTTSYLQAAERLAAWALFMPGEYKITVRRVRATEDGLSPEIVISSRFGQGGLAKIERESHIHRLVLKLAKELAGREDLHNIENATDKILAASWLLASAILNAPDGKKPSEGLAILAEKGVLPRAALNRLKPIFEGLDALLGSVSRVDKAYLVGKLVDYDGSVNNGHLLVSAEKIKKIPIELDGVEIRMADVAEAAAKAFSEKGEWSGNELSFGPAKDVPELKVDKRAPLKAPTFKAMAALMARETREGAKELRRKELVEYVELYRYKGDRLEIKIMAAKAKEVMRTPITQKNREEVWKGFEDRKYTHLRLVVRGEEYELHDVEDRSAGRVYVRFRIRGERAQKLAEALKGLGLNVELPPSGYLFLYREHLEALLDKGVEAYAVRKAKRGEAMWRLEITYRGVTMALEMSYHERDGVLQKHSKTGKIKVFVREEGAAKGEWMELYLGLLAAIREGQLAVIKERCKNRDNCPEKQLAEALNDIASKNPGFGWSVTGEREKNLIIKPPNLKDVVRRFYSNT